jgi:DNA polymerase
MPLTISAAHTHRLGGTNKLNPQNFTRGSPLRRALIAPKGHVVVVVDSSNIEARILAWLAEEDHLLQLFATGADVYAALAPDIFGYSITKETHPVERFICKVIRLGLGYHMGGLRLQQTFAAGAMGGPKMNFSLLKCEEFVQVYRQRHPRIRGLWRQAEQFLALMCEPDTCISFKGVVIQHRRIRLPNGLYLNYPNLMAEERRDRPGHEFTYHNGKHTQPIHGGVAVENITQALAQVLIRWQMLKIQAFLDTIGGRLVLQSHDENALIVPETEGQRTLDETIRLMQELPDWCNDGTLVLGAEGGFANNYSK